MELGFQSIQELTYFLNQLGSFGNNPLAIKIEKPDKALENAQFCAEKIWFNNASINVFDVIGSKDCNWVGRTWKDVVLYGQRIQQNALLLLQNPIYYLEEKPKNPPMSYIKIGSELFTNDDGIQRTALAKLLFLKMGRIQLNGADVKEYKVDYVFKQLYNELLEIYFDKKMNFTIMRKSIARTNGVGWFREFYSLSLSLTNLKNGKKILLENTDEMEMLKNELQSKNFMSRFKRNKFIEFIY